MSEPEENYVGVIGYFRTPDPLPEALDQARQLGFTDVEAYLPVGDEVTAEHAVPQGSPVKWIALGGGATGIVLGLVMTIWMSWDYPVVTGGKPITSLPPFLVISFELMILLATFGAIGAFLWCAKLPRLRPSDGYCSELGVDTCALLIRSLSFPRDRARAERILREAGALEIRCVEHCQRGLLGEPD